MTEEESAVRRAWKRWLTWSVMASLWLGLTLASQAATQTVIQHYHNPAHGPDWTNWLKDQIKRYEALNPDTKIELIVPASSVGADQFLTLIASGTPIDVSELVLRIGASVAAQGAYMDLRPFLRRSTKLSLEAYVPVARTAMTRPDGTVWGIPVDLYIVPTHYHAEMFANAGLPTPADLGTEWNFDAALTASKRLTMDRNGDGQMDQWGTQTGYTLWVYRNAFENRGAEWFDRDIEPTRSLLNTPKVSEALRWVADLHLVHNVADPASGAYSSAFPMGKYGWSLGTGPNTAKLLAQANADFKWGVALPIGGERQGAYTAVNSFQIPKTSKNPDAAWRWIEFLLSTDESWTSFINNTSRLPANQRIMPLWLRMIQSMPNAPEGAYNYILAAAHADNYLDILSPYYARFDQLAEPLIRSVLQGQRNPSAALEELHQKMTAMFNEGR